MAVIFQWSINIFKSLTTLSNIEIVILYIYQIGHKISMIFFCRCFFPYVAWIVRGKNDLVEHAFDRSIMSRFRKHKKKMKRKTKIYISLKCTQIQVGHRHKSPLFHFLKWLLWRILIGFFSLALWCYQKQ